MSGISGKNIELSIFGESHGKGIGIIINGLPPGIKLDFDYINNEMQRRAPGQNRLSTTRKERDNFEIISGFFNNKTTGTPLCCIIWNEDTQSKDYHSIKNIMRPGHADFSGYMKYHGYNDYRGGGHFSGRLTAPLVFAGAIAKWILQKQHIYIGSHIKSIGHIKEHNFDWVNIDDKHLELLNTKKFPVLDIEVGKKMEEFILSVKKEGDSIGGIVETAITNISPGIGEPFFHSVEGMISKYLFSIPSIKGVEFGAGFNITEMKGSEANDTYYIDNNKVKTTSNNNGGLLGGITNGMPVVFKTAIKPTSSIEKIQKTIDIASKEEINLSVKGRHDPCIVPRVIPVIESVACLCILDLICERNGAEWMI